jgi:ankyrin repeat protein
MIKAIEANQAKILQFLLKKHPLKQTLNLLHIACKTPNGPSGSILKIVKAIMDHDKFANLSEQDTYGNTPLHLASLTQKADVLAYFMDNFTPRLDLKNNEGNNPMQVSSTEEIAYLFAGSI